MYRGWSYPAQCLVETNHCFHFSSPHLLFWLFGSRPVRVIKDPIRGDPHVLVMCEVFAPDGSPHPTNTRAKLRDIIDDKVLAEDCWYGLEQEYTMIQKTTGQIYGWPSGGYPAPQVG